MNWKMNTYFAQLKDKLQGLKLPYLRDKLNKFQ